MQYTNIALKKILRTNELFFYRNEDINLRM